MVVKVERTVIPVVFTTIRTAQERQAQRVEKFHEEDLQSMRNRINEKEEQLKILLDLITEFEERSLKTNRNTEHEILLKCAEILQDFASNLMKEVINEK